MKILLKLFGVAVLMTASFGVGAFGGICAAVEAFDYPRSEHAEQMGKVIDAARVFNESVDFNKVAEKSK